jgi:hypothetical protein
MVTQRYQPSGSASWQDLLPCGSPQLREPVARCRCQKSVVLVGPVVALIHRSGAKVVSGVQHFAAGLLVDEVLQAPRGRSPARLWDMDVTVGTRDRSAPLLDMPARGLTSVVRARGWEIARRSESCGACFATLLVRGLTRAEKGDQVIGIGRVRAPYASSTCRQNSPTLGKYGTPPQHLGCHGPDDGDRLQVQQLLYARFRECRTDDHAASLLDCWMQPWPSRGRDPAFPDWDAASPGTASGWRRPTEGVTRALGLPGRRRHRRRLKQKVRRT